MALAGKNAAAKIGAAIVKEVNDANFSLDGELVDVTTFDADGWQKRLQGVKGASVSIGGYYDPTDTTGQVALRAAWLAGTKVPAVTVLADKSVATSGFKADCFVSTFEISPGVDGAVSFSASLESDGPVTVSS